MEEEIIKKIGNTTYYKNRKDAEIRRRYNERIYFTKGLGYYLVREEINK